MFMEFIEKPYNYYECKQCLHHCATHDKGKTFVVESGAFMDGDFICLKGNEYAPCGENFYNHFNNLMEDE